MKELEQHPHQSRRRLALSREEQMLEAGRERSVKKRAKKLVSNTNAGVEFRDRYLDAVNQQILTMLQPYEDGKGGRKHKWYKAIKAVDTRLTAAMTINSFVDAAQKGLSMTAAREQTGKMFVALLFDQLCYGNPEREKAFQRFKQAMMHKLGDTYRRADLFLMRATDLGFDAKQYANRNMLISIGTKLQDCFTLAGLLDWEKFKKGDDTHATRYLKLSEEIMKHIEDRNDRYFDLQSPMFSATPEPPNSWLKHEDGWTRSGPYEDAMLNFRHHFVRHMGEDQKKEVEERIENGKLNKVLEAVHIIQNTPYVINEYVLAAVQWVRDEKLGSDVSSWPNLEKVKVDEVLTDIQKKAMKSQEQKDYNKGRDEQIEANMAAGASATMLKRYAAPPDPDNPSEPYGEANKLLEQGHFYMPHNCDNRGRIYHINDFGHHDTDYIRAMFSFAAEWEVTQDNIAWLYLQLANTYGNKMDKLTVDLHQQFYADNKEAILACGEDFRNSFDIWSGADDSFQFLAACREIYLAETAWAKGETYYSGLPIAVDASQSGVQHLALSLLHKDNCKRVNLSNTEQRHDIYDDCLVYAIGELFKGDKATRQLWLSNDPVTEADRKAADEHQRKLDEVHEVDGKQKLVLTGADRRAAKRRWRNSGPRRRLQWEKELEIIKQLEKQMKAEVLPYGRKVIKRNVMTYCYSSRQYGFANQLRSDWMDKLSEKVRQGKLEEHPFGSDRGFAASIYIASVHEEAIEEIVRCAKDGMKFIQEVTSILARHRMPKPSDSAVPLTDDEKKEMKTYNRNGIHLRFLTPEMNFPMYQNYIKETTKDQELTFYDKPLKDWRKEYLSIHVEHPDQLWVEKSINACAPNIVHAMDATHLMMTVLECKKQGIEDIMVVHDSFACGIGDMVTLSEALRNTLVDLYRDYNLYEDLLAQAKARHPDPDSVEWPEPPKRGKFNIDEVYDSKYSFL